MEAVRKIMETIHKVTKEFREAKTKVKGVSRNKDQELSASGQLHPRR